MFKKGTGYSKACLVCLYHDTTTMLIGLVPYTKHSAVLVSLKLVLLLAASSNVKCFTASKLVGVPLL